jgi:hypothetical protein
MTVPLGMGTHRAAALKLPALAKEGWLPLRQTGWLVKLPLAPRAT